MLVIAVSDPPASVLVLIELVVLPPKLPTDSWIFLKGFIWLSNITFLKSCNNENLQIIINNSLVRGNCQGLDQTLIISCNWVHFRLVWLSLKMRTEDKNNNFFSPQRQPAALISRYHMVPHSSLCVCVCVFSCFWFPFPFSCCSLWLYSVHLCQICCQKWRHGLFWWEKQAEIESWPKHCRYVVPLSTLHFHCASIKVADLHDLSWSTSLFCVF